MLFLGAGLNVAGANQEGQALEAQAKYQQKMYEFNSILAEKQADDAIERGEQDVRTVRLETRKLVGSQRAALAAQGLDPDSGSASAVVDETRMAGIKDESTIRTNALREAFGFKIDALNSRASGQLGVLAAKSKASSGILNAGLSGLSTTLTGLGKLGR